MADKNGNEENKEEEKVWNQNIISSQQAFIEHWTCMPSPVLDPEDTQREIQEPPFNMLSKTVKDAMQQKLKSTDWDL